MNALTNHSSCVQRRFKLAWLITSDASISTNQDRVTLWQDSKNILGRKSLFGIELGNNRTHNWIEQYSQQAISTSPTPHLVGIFNLTGQQKARVNICKNEIAPVLRCA